MTPTPPPQTPQYLTILRTERGRHYVCRILAPPMQTTPQYLTILMTERGGAIIFYTILASPTAPPPQTPQYLTNLMAERGRRGAICLYDFSASNAPPPTTPQYLTNLMTERGGAIIFYMILAPPNAPPLPRRHNT